MTVTHICASRCVCTHYSICVSRCVYLVVCVSRCVMHNVHMRTRLDLVCFWGIPLLDLVQSHKSLRDYMCIRNHTWARLDLLYYKYSKFSTRCQETQDIYNSRLDFVWIPWPVGSRPWLLMLCSLSPHKIWPFMILYEKLIPLLRLNKNTLLRIQIINSFIYKKVFKNLFQPYLVSYYTISSQYPPPSGVQFRPSISLQYVQGHLSHYNLDAMCFWVLLW